MANSSIDKVRAEVLPGDKGRRRQALRDAGEVVAFVGDGLNDGPAQLLPPRCRMRWPAARDAATGPQASR